MSKRCARAWPESSASRLIASASRPRPAKDSTPSAKAAPSQFRPSSFSNANKVYSQQMRPQEIIRHKRDGGELSRGEIESFVRGVVEGNWADYQSSALLMAVYLNGMTTAAMEALTQAMLHSGEVLDFSHLDAPVADNT